MIKILVTLLISFSAFAQQTAKPTPTKGDINLPLEKTPDPAVPEWGWVGGEDAEAQLLKMSEDLQNGIKGIMFFKEIAPFSTWWIFPQDDDTYQAPKAMRIQMNHPGHDTSKPPEIKFIIEYKIGRISVPLISFMGILRGISVRKNSTEQFIYLYLKSAEIEPSADQSYWGKTVSITCEICDTAKENLRTYVYRLGRYVNDNKHTLSVHFTGKKDDRVAVDVVPRK